MGGMPAWAALSSELEMLLSAWAWPCGWARPGKGWAEGAATAGGRSKQEGWKKEGKILFEIGLAYVFAVSEIHFLLVCFQNEKKTS